MKSRRTVLLHLGHLGLAWDSMTYMRHRGHPTSTMGAAVPLSGLLKHSCSASDDTHDPSIDISDDDDDDVAESALLECVLGSGESALC
ncbi:hypothetical protein TorRG33x02_271250 [Trema orientale]|uniref:Secreted protein n=1 Tax=Trema orientale TaxID=63057 RepID=A0A2P5CW32_TREOI|nr:hypothetical protein TorRG33x02_271250 [Trema orientale]